MRLLFVCLLVTAALVSALSAKAQGRGKNPQVGSSASGQVETRGMECVPKVREVETRRAIPIQCTTDYEVFGVELRYRQEGGKWAKIELQSSGDTWTGMVPCQATAKPGLLKVYVFAKNEANKVVGRVGRSSAPLLIRIVEHTKVPAPALPNQPAPTRCFEKTECPPDMLGTDACPGTQASASVKRAWGASCSASSQCEDGLECLNGSCETPPKCEGKEDCPAGAECTDGICKTPSPEELAERLGPPMHHWFGLHFGADLMLMSEADGVCGPDGAGQTEDSKRFACYQAGNPYTGTPNRSNAGHLSSTFSFATVRAMLSYDYAWNRLLFGGRVGWAFRGAPKDFTPIHVEARASYSLRKDVFNKSFRPYLGLAVGMAQVDAAGTVKIVDCVDSATRDECENAVGTEINQYLLPDGTGNVRAVQRVLNAYRSGSRFFFGPTLHTVFALANDSAIVVNINVMFPDVVFQPSLGYEMAL